MNTDLISRADAEALFRTARSKLNPSDYKSADEFNTRDLMLLNAEQMIHLLPSVTPNQVPCEDAISRQTAIDEIMGRRPDAHYPDYYASIIRNLPSVHEEPRTGHWIKHNTFEKWECSCCGVQFRFSFKEHYFCPNCGAKMEEQ